MVENASLCKTIGLTSKLLGIYVNEHLQRSGIELTRPQFVVLKILTSKNGICQNDLAFITEQDKTSLTRLINTLETKGLVNRKTANEDKRKNKIYITEKGSEILDEAWPLMEQVEHDIAKTISEEDLEKLITVLNKVQSNISILKSEEV